MFHKVDNRRKVMVVSVAFRELGQASLVRNDVWLTVAVVRSTIIDTVVGGWAAMLRLLLEDMLLGPLGLATAGLPLLLPEPTMMFAALTNILADGDGLRLAYDWRGASSLKPCLVHHNVLKKASGLAEHGTGFCDITCHDFSAFRSWSPVDVAQVIHLLREANGRVVAGSMSKAKESELQMACGMRYNEFGMLASQKLRAHADLLGCATFDWVHTALQDGCFVIEASLVVQACGDQVHVI